jgi:hypothetical protein
LPPIRIDTEDDDNDIMDAKEGAKIRARIHNLSDVVQKHEIRLAEDKVLIEAVTSRVDGIIRTMATGEQLRAAETNIGLQLTNNKTQLEGQLTDLRTQMTNVKEDLAPIRSGINWVATLIIGAVILAILALVLRPTIFGPAPAAMTSVPVPHTP